MIAQKPSVFHILLWCGLIIFSSVANAESQSFPPIKDTYVDQSYPHSNYGSLNTTYFGTSIDDELMCTLLEYDLTSIPVGSRINSVSLKFFVRVVTVFSLSMILGDRRLHWAENTVNWNTSDVQSDTIVGYPLIYMSSTGYPSVYTTFFNSGLESLVKKWIDNPSANRGLSLCPRYVDGSYAGFESKEHYRPVSLNVNYSPPSAGTKKYSEQVIADGASHYYRLLEKDGTVVADSAGNSPGSVFGDVVLGLDGAIADEYDKAARFNGVDSYISVPGTNLNFTGAISIEAWLINENQSPARFISDGINGIKGIGAGITDYGRSEHDYALFFTTLGVKDYLSDVQLPLDGAFHHVVVSLNADFDVRFYLDGQLQQVVMGQSAPINSDLSLHIGQNAGGAILDSWRGVIDEIAIYPLVLSDDQVLEHYELGRSAIFKDSFEQ